MRSTMMQSPLTLTSVLERAGKFFGGVEIVSRMPDKSLHRGDYTGLYRRARALAAALAGEGLRCGERVASLMWNHARHLEAYFGVPASGNVLHTLNLRLHPDELAYIVNDAGDRALILDEALLPLYEKMREKVRFERVIVVPGAVAPVAPPFLNYEELLGRGDPDYQFPEIDESAPAVMCYTSGTTGAPKGVVYSHRALALHSLAIALPDSFDLAQDGCIMPVVPMFHANAWGCPYSAAIVGMKQVLPGPHLDAASLLDLLAGENVTRTAGVPTVWIGILEMLDREPGRWKLNPRLRVTVGGSALPESMVQAFDRHGIEVRQAWGMTEIAPVGTVSTLRRHAGRRPASERVAVRARQGTPLPFIELRAMEGEREVPWDGRSVGELQVRGPWVASAYHNLPGQQSWTGDGWFRTGDVVTVNAEGSIKIVDRTKDLIKSGGEWISSVDLENALMGHPAVREAAVIAVPHPKWQERPLAVVVLKDGCWDVSDSDLRAHLAERFSAWQLPDAIIFAGEIPRTSVGKMQKSRLRQQFEGWSWERAAAAGD